MIEDKYTLRSVAGVPTGTFNHRELAQMISEHMELGYENDVRNWWLVTYEDVLIRGQALIDLALMMRSVGALAA